MNLEMTAIVVLLVLFSLALLVIIGLAAQLNDERTRNRWLAMELKDAGATATKLRENAWEREAELKARLAPFRGVRS